jgi:hypothetical protein
MAAINAKQLIDTTRRRMPRTRWSVGAVESAADMAGAVAAQAQRRNRASFINHLPRHG